MSVMTSTVAINERAMDLRACPVCGTGGAAVCLEAPDRFHGKEERYKLLRCQTCSLVWLDSPPRPEDMHQHYTDAYHNLISQSGDNPGRWGFRKDAILRLKQSGALLDLGCSSGAFLAFMKDEAWTLHGVEMSPGEATEARLRSGAQVFVGSVADATFEKNSFDVITCFDVLEHLYEPRLVLQRVVEWLRPGGIFYVLVPNIDSAESRVFGGFWHGLELPRHLFHYSPVSLKYLAEKAGLSAVSIETRRNSAVGTSLRYVWDTAFRSVGIQRTPVAYRGKTSIPWRAICKLTRVTVLRSLLTVAPLVGGGESIHAIFQKSGNGNDR